MAAPATAAAAVQPRRASRSSGSTVYIADTNNCVVRGHRRRRSTPSPEASAAASPGTAGRRRRRNSRSLSAPASTRAETSTSPTAQNCRVRKIARHISTLPETAPAATQATPATARGSLCMADERAVARPATSYIADTGNCRVRKVSAGIITTIAGTATCGTVATAARRTSANSTRRRASRSTRRQRLHRRYDNCRDPQSHTGRTITTIAGTASVRSAATVAPRPPRRSARSPDSH